MKRKEIDIEMIILKKANNQKHISENLIFKLGGLEFINQILKKYGLKLVFGYTHIYYGKFYKFQTIKRSIPTKTTPCFLRIESCGHVRTCYLAPKCPAALNHARLAGIPQNELGIILR